MLLGMGCTIPSSKSMVPGSQVGQLQSTEVGTIVKVRDVAIEGRRSTLGQYGGAVIGGAAARPSGGISSTGGALGVAVASVAGAIVGESVEEYATRKNAQEITVQLKDGNMVTIVQPAPPNFMAGDVVEIIHGPGGAWVKMYLEGAGVSVK
jgi:outer membrane lipoprotein SlyB